MTEKNATDQLAVEISAMHKWYGSFHVQRDQSGSCQRRAHRHLCPSGSGKSTMIRYQRP